MKYLSDYMQDKQTAMFDELGVFFAFGNDQLKEGMEKVGATEYSQIVGMGHGMYALKKNAAEVSERLDTIYQEAILEDKKENGKENIIRRELGNYECFYTGDISEAVDSLKDYGYTEEEVRAVYKKGE